MPVAVLEVGVETVTPTKIEGLAGAELNDLNGNLMTKVLGVVGLTRKCDCLLIFLTLAFMSRRDRIKSLKFFAFLAVINRSLNSSFTFS